MTDTAVKPTTKPTVKTDGPKPAVPKMISYACEECGTKITGRKHLEVILPVLLCPEHVSVVTT